jgi:V8-like Glu-specific endopeptidase
MLRLTHIAVSLSALYHGLVHANPVPQEPVQRGDPGDLLGFDPSLKELFKSDAIIPEIHELSLGELHNFTVTADAATSAEPFVPSLDEFQASLDKRFIVGEDNRRYNSDTNYPFSAIGKLIWSNGAYCSGALVGPRHVLTARHCLPSSGDVSLAFIPGYNNGAPYGTAQVQYAITLPKQSGACDTKADWSILIIDQRFGDRLGYFGFKWPERNLFDQPTFLHQGYPSDRDGGSRPYIHSNTKIHSSTSLDCDSSGPFYSDTDTMGGQSGGPFWENASSGAYIWGTLSITVTSSLATFAGWASGSQILESINRLRSEYP